MSPIEAIEGDGPVVLGQPHSGTFLPADVRAALNARGCVLADTDWRVDRLYNGLLPSATVVRARFHRYVIDANRPPSGESLYPGQATTGLVPLTDFDGAPIWETAPDAAGIARRVAAFHAPYHAALEAALAQARARWGVAVLYDCHSIRGDIPNLFEGRLPDLNIGDFEGRSCAPEITAIARDLCAASDYSSVVNGRFKGGWCTRHYGRPAEGMHAIQMELAQATHLASESPPFAYDPDKAHRLRALLVEILHRIDAWARAQ